MTAVRPPARFGGLEEDCTLAINAHEVEVVFHLGAQTRSLVLGERPVLCSDGTNVRDYFYVRDIVAAYLSLAENVARSNVKDEAFNFGLQSRVNVIQIVLTICDLMGCARRFWSARVSISPPPTASANSSRRWTPCPSRAASSTSANLVSLVDSSLDFWLTTGRFEERFEREFARWYGVRECVLVNSGSSANLLAAGGHIGRFSARCRHRISGSERCCS